MRLKNIIAFESIARILALGALLLAPAAAQQTVRLANRPPDCYQQFGPLTAAGTTFDYDNRASGCSEWTVTYSSSGFTVISLSTQAADTNAGGTGAGVYGAMVGTITAGINPNTSTTKAETDFSGAYTPWVRINLATATGTGIVYGELHGWRNAPAIKVTLTSGGGNTPVIGPTAAGSPPTTAPVLIAGQDGAPGNIRTVKTDSSGNQIAVGPTATGAVPSTNPLYLAGVGSVPGGDGFLHGLQTDNNGRVIVSGIAAANAALGGNPVPIAVQDPSGNAKYVASDANGDLIPAGLATAQADGVSNTPTIPSVGPAAAAVASTQRVYNYRFNASTWDRDFVCATQARVSLTDATRTQLVALSGSTVIRVCHIHVTTTAVEDITVSYGTGSACGTGTTTVDKYLSVQSVAMDFQPTAALRTIAANALCITQSAVQNAEVTVIYAQF